MNRPTAASSRGRRVATWLAAVVLGLGAIGGVFFYFEPVRIARWASRRALDRAGLERATLAAPTGRLHYWRAPGTGTGSKGTMVLLHGMGDQSGTWARVVLPLGREYRLLLLDLPGHGSSEPETGPLPFDLFPRGLLALLEHEAPREAVTLVGNSMGGWVALRFALEHPDRVAAIWGLGAAALYRDLAPLTLTPSNRAEAIAFIDAITGPNVPPPAGFFLDDYVQAVQHGSTRRILAALKRSDFLESRLPNLRTPVHLIWGEADGLLPVEYGRRLQSLIPGATFEAIPGCGHVPQWECPGPLLERMGVAVAARSAEPPS
jgi:pimeloyl-ACP methyl ester carboxylesterase